MPLEKKLQKAREEGYTTGFNQACDFWEFAITHTKGIGPALQSRLMDTVREMARQTHEARHNKEVRP